MSAASATRTSQWRGASDACCPAWPMSLIWALILGNWTMNEVLRPERWSAPVVALGYVLVILTVVSFFQCVCTHPGAAPAAWRAAALDGAEPLTDLLRICAEWPSEDRSLLQTQLRALLHYHCGVSSLRTRQVMMDLQAL